MSVPAVLQEQRDRRRSVVEPWFCEGTLTEGKMAGRPCRKVLMELDWDRPSHIHKTCERCGYKNIFVEAYRPAV